MIFKKAIDKTKILKIWKEAQTVQRTFIRLVDIVVVIDKTDSLDFINLQLRVVNQD